MKETRISRAIHWQQFNNERLQEKSDNGREWSYKYTLIILNLKTVHYGNAIVCEKWTESVLLLQGMRNRNNMLLTYTA